MVQTLRISCPTCFKDFKNSHSLATHSYKFHKNDDGYNSDTSHIITHKRISKSSETNQDDSEYSNVTSDEHVASDIDINSVNSETDEDTPLITEDKHAFVDPVGNRKNYSETDTESKSAYFRNENKGDFEFVGCGSSDSDSEYGVRTHTRRVCPEQSKECIDDKPTDSAVGMAEETEDSLERPFYTLRQVFVIKNAVISKAITSGTNFNDIIFRKYLKLNGSEKITLASLYLTSDLGILQRLLNENIDENIALINKISSKVL